MKNYILFTFLFILLFLFNGSKVAAQGSLKNKLISFQDKGGDKAPIVLLKDTIFFITQPMGAFSIHNRAERINKLLDDLLVTGKVEPDSFYLISIEPNIFVYYEEMPVLMIAPGDTTGLGLTQEELSETILLSLKESFKENIHNYSIKTITKNILYTGIIIILVAVVVFLLNILFRRIYKYLDSRKSKYFKGWTIRDYTILNSSQQFRLARSILRIIKIGVIILVIFIALPVIFTLFPATEGITRKIVQLIWEPIYKILLGIVRFVPDLITIIIIYIVFRFLIRGLKFIASEIEKNNLVLPGFYPEWAKPTFSIIRAVMYIFMFIMIFPLLPGSDSNIFQGVTVFVGLLISLGSSNAIANAVAGIVITYMRPFKVGDRIKIEDIIGTVMEKSALVTRIRTIKNEDVTIPNAKILTSYTINYSDPARETGLIIHTTITIGYDAPWRKVHELLISAASKTRGVMKDPAPFVLQISLDDFYISYQINAYINNANKVLQIKSDLHQNIQDSFNKGGIEIMSPHYRAERDGNEITIPKNWKEDELIPPQKDQPGEPDEAKKDKKPKAK